MLFNVYMDELSIKLNRSGIEGNIGDYLFNNLCYADNLYLFSVSAASMQKILDICSTYAIKQSLMVNVFKSFSQSGIIENLMTVFDDY